MEKTAIIYGRVSTTRQADEGLPIESQLEQGQQKAAALGAKVLKVFVDEGISGRTARRPAFQEAIAFCAEFRVDFFIVWSTSRFARNKIDAASFKKLLAAHGTKVVYVSCDVDSTTDEGWFTDSIFEIVDEHYSRVIAKDTRRSMMKNARDGYFNGGRVPFGYTAVDAGRRRRLEIAPLEAKVVRDIYQMFIEGCGTKEIALRLNEQGISRRGAKWDKNTVAFILKSRVYTGHVVFNRVSHTDRVRRPESEWIITPSHAPIVTEEIFAEVARLMEIRSPKTGNGSPHSQHVFTGLLRCGRCGSSMQTESAKGRNRYYHYYNCRAAQKGIGCTNRRIPSRELDAWLIDSVFERLFTEQRVREIIREVHQLTDVWEKERQARLEALDGELRIVERKMSKLFEVLELHGKDTPNLGDLTKRLRAHKEQKDSLEREIDQLEMQPAPEVKISEKDVREASDFFRSLLHDGDAKKVRLFLGQVVKAVTVYDDSVHVEYYPERIVGRAPGDVVRGVRSKKGVWLPDLGSNQGPAD